jgi:hypothetical protein
MTLSIISVPLLHTKEVVLFFFCYVYLLTELIFSIEFSFILDVAIQTISS